MADNPYVNKVIYGSSTLMDISDTTADDEDVAEGKVYYKASGLRSVGTASGGITPTGTIPISANGTYDVTNYASADVNVSGSGGDTDPFPVRNDGNTHLWVLVDNESDMEVSLRASRNTSPGVIIDWGDGTSNAVDTDRASHTYSELGVYEITISRNGNGGWGVRFTTTIFGIMGSDSYNAERLLAAEMGITSGTSLYNGLTQTFVKCNNLSKLTLRGVPSLGNQNIFYLAKGGLIYVDLGSTITGTAGAFRDMTRLRSVDTSNTPLVNISSNSFNGCTHLRSFSVPNTVTTIGAHAFAGCVGLVAIHFLPTTPPTVSDANAWENLPTDCVIYVPTGTLSDYQAATNYPDPATYTYVEE